MEEDCCSLVNTGRVGDILSGEKSMTKSIEKLMQCIVFIICKLFLKASVEERVYRSWGWNGGEDRKNTYGH